MSQHSVAQHSTLSVAAMSTIQQMADESPEVAEAATAVGEAHHDEVVHSKRAYVKGLL